MKYIFSLLVLSSFLLFSCSNEKIGEKLEGKWNIENAFRNGRKTSTLEQTYFIFQNSDILETNLLGSKVNSNYSLKKNVIISDNNLPEIIVKKIENDSLIFEFTIEDNHFELTMIKSSDE